LYPSTNIVKVIKSRNGGACSRHGRDQKCKTKKKKLLVGASEVKRPLGRRRRRWILAKYGVKAWAGLGPVTGFCQHCL